MSNQFLKLRRSAVPGKVPTTSSLEFGEIALNTHDGLAFMKKSGSNGEEIVTIGSTSGSFTGSLFGTASYALTSSYSDNIFGEPYYVAVYTGQNTLFTGSIYDSASFTAIGTNAPNDPSNVERLLVDAGQTTSYNLIIGQAELDNYLQFNLRNAYTGVSSSADFVVTNDSGNETTNYVDLGINSSVYDSASGVVGGPNDAYLYSTGHDLLIGNASAGNRVVIFNGGLDSTANAKIFIHPEGVTGFNTDSTASLISAEVPAIRVIPANTTTYNIIQAEGDIDNYLQNNIQNLNTGSSASTDIVATGDIGTESTYYIDMGVNSSGYNVPNAIGTASDAYIYSTANHLHIGNASAGMPVMIFAGGLDSEANRKLELWPDNQHYMTGSLEMSGSLKVRIVDQNDALTSLVVVDTATGLLQYTNTASYANIAATASSADDLIIRGNMTGSNALFTGTVTAQTLHVQYVTASTEFITGSTIFGTQLTDTHQFTGSVSITGSLSVQDLSLNAGLTQFVVVDPATGTLYYNTSGASGTSGTSGQTGTSGTSGQTGASGTSGTSGLDGSSGTSGQTGASGTSGTSGESGTSGTSGQTGASGTSGTSGQTGASGTSGTSGESGTSGISGTAGSSGTSGTGSPGTSGTSGTSGLTGTSGTSGSDGSSGTSGQTGTSGTSGTSGESGTSGTTGSSGTSGLSGTAGSSGTSGTSGESGTSGTSGSSGTAGSSGTSGTGFDTITNFADNRILTSLGTSNTANAEANLTFDGSTLSITGSIITTGNITAQTLYVQEITSSREYITGSTIFGSQLSDTHQFTGSVSITGSLSIQDLSLNGGLSRFVVVDPTTGQLYYNNAGAAGSSGSSGTSGTAGSSGTSGANGTSGTSGTSGSSGTSGTSGSSGSSGTSGSSGSSGTSGSSGSSGTSGESGTSGTSGSSGSSGTSGTGFNTIHDPAQGRILLSDGSVNAATASANLTYTGSAFYITGSVFISGSLNYTSGSITNADYIQFNTNATVTDAVGKLYYNKDEGILNVGLAGGNVVANIGEDLYQYVYNNTGAPLTKGQVVYISGSQGNRIAVKLASATAEQGSAQTLGFVAEAINTGAEGWVQTEGVLRKLNTTGLVGGQLIYLSSSAGEYTQTKPQAPLHEVRLGYAERIDATVGSIYIKIDNGYEIDELHNVKITGESDGDLLISSGSLWINSKQLTGSYGLTGSLTATSFTGSLQGTASWANNAITASHAQTASSADAFTVRNFIELLPGTDPGTANVSASYFFVTSSADNTEQNLHYRNNGALWETHWLEQVTNTGLVWGGILTFTASLTDTPPNRTEMRITPGAGLIVNHNANTGSHGDTIPTYVEFGPITASADFITSSQVTYLLIDENGQLIQQTTKFTPEQYVEKFPLGYIFCLTTSSISSYADARVTTYGQVEQEGQFVRAFGPLKLSGYDITAQTGSLKVSIAAGQSYRYGGFYTQNPDSPSIYDSTAVATGSLVRVYRDPGVTGGFRAATNAGLPFTDIDPTKWDDGSGTLQTVGADEWTIQRLFQGVVNGVSYIYYGQNVYSSLALALQSITTDQFVESPTSILALPFIGYVIAKGNTTDIGDTTNNRIIQAGLFRNTAGSSGGGGAAAQNLNDLGDVNIVGATNGQALIYNSGLWINGNPTSASYATTASYVQQAVSASYSTVASYSLATKAGNIVGGTFSGNPRKATVTFGSAFPNTSYSVTVTGEDSRAWSIESKLAGSFVINANSNTALNGTTYWIATQYNS